MDGPGDSAGTPRSSSSRTSTELVQRDKNHPSVIMWSVANEPLTKPFHTTNPEPPESVERGTEFFGPMFDLFRQLGRHASGHDGELARRGRWTGRRSAT